MAENRWHLKKGRNPDLGNELGAIVRKVRMDRKMSIRKLAKICKIDGGEISRFERGLLGVSWRKVKPILDYLGIKRVYLVEDTTPKPRETKAMVCKRCLHRQTIDL